MADTTITPAVNTAPIGPQQLVTTGPAPSTPTGGAAVQAPNTQVAYSFLDGSGYNNAGQQVRPPTVVSAKAATDDLAKKQADLTTATTAQANQAATVASNSATAAAQTSQPKPVTADDISKAVNTGYDYSSIGLTDQVPANKIVVDQNFANTHDMSNPAFKNYVVNTPAPEGFKYMYDSAGNRVQVPASPAQTTNDQLRANQDKQDAAYQDFSNSLNQIRNGTFPLTPDQLSQVNALQQQFDQLKQQQQLANKNYEGGVVNAGIAAGRNRYAPELELGNIQASISAGIQKIASIDAQAASAISQLKQGFMDNDYKLINAAYTAASDFFRQKSETIQKLSDNVRQQTQDAIQAHKDKIAEQQKQIENSRNAVTFAKDNGVTKPFYVIGNQAYDTNTGLPVSLADYQKMTGQQVGLPESQTDFGQIQHIADPSVMKLSNDYPDAGINPTDSIDQARAKLKNSDKYKKETYIAPPAGGTIPTGNYSPGENPVVDSWVQNIANGSATIANVPAAYKNAVSVAMNSLPTTLYTPLAGSRFTMESNRIVSNFVDLPAYQLTAGGQLYLGRINAALKTPGSVSDQDLLDSLTKLNTGGNAISDAQVRIITDGKSLSDWAGTIQNKFNNGGVLSDNQRQQIQTLAQNIFKSYQDAYQPIYDQVSSQLTAAGVPKAFWTIPDLNTLQTKVEQNANPKGLSPEQIKSNNALYTPETNKEIWSLAQPKGITAQDLTDLSNQGYSPDEVKSFINSYNSGGSPTSFNSVGNTTASTSGARTDRHNNPVAMTTAVAKDSGLVLGKDYVQGDSFKGSDGKIYYTAKFLGDPIATTIKAIDKGGFTTASGKPRWSYLSSIPEAKNWSNLTYNQKKNVIAQMYKHEGGSALLNNFA